MRIWNDCIQIYQNKSFLIELDDDMLVAWERYTERIKRKPTRSVWYDTIEKTCFGTELNCINSTSLEAFFLTHPEDFLEHQKCGRIFVEKYFGEALGLKVKENDEVIYQDFEELEKFKGAKILLVGGGPTTNMVDWNPDEYDYVWSCNHFYLSEKMQEIDIALATLGNEVDLSLNNKLLYNYLDLHSTIIGFENTHRPISEIKFLSDTYPKRIFYSHGRYRGKIGTIPRLMCFAVLIGVGEIHFVGMDGMGPETKRGDFQGHAFEKDKLYGIGTLDYNVFRRHFVLLWDYIIHDLDLLNKVRFQNLGEGHPKNQSTDISREMFPLKIEINRQF